MSTSFRVIPASCPDIVETGTFGTLTFAATGVDQTADSIEHCNDYTNNSEFTYSFSLSKEL